MNLLHPLGGIDDAFQEKIANFRRLKATTSPNVYDQEFYAARTATPMYGYVEVQNDDVRSFYMLTNNDDIIAEFYLWYGRNSYERTTIREWVRKLKTASVVFDIGSNTGIFSLLSCFADDQSRQIVAFEPTFRACARVYENLNVNGMIDRVKVEKVALSNQAGTVNFSHFENATRISSGASYVEGVSHFDVCYRELCECTTLDAYVANSGLIPDLIKIDVEGAEVDVMEGARELIARKATSFIIEVVPQTAEQVTAYFDGYKVMLLDDHLNRAVPWTGEIAHHVNLLVEP
jgi:FkbM family methyltransferase